jgi:hypothetical protein
VRALFPAHGALFFGTEQLFARAKAASGIGRACRIWMAAHLSGRSLIEQPAKRLCQPFSCTLTVPLAVTKNHEVRLKADQLPGGR